MGLISVNKNERKLEVFDRTLQKEAIPNECKDNIMDTPREAFSF